MALTPRQETEYLRMEIAKVIETRIERPVRLFKNLLDNSNSADELRKESLALALILDMSVNNLATAADFPYKEDKSVDYLKMLLEIQQETDALRVDMDVLKRELEKYQTRNQNLNTMDF